MGDGDSWSVQFKRGLIEVFVLQLLTREPLYGYALVQQLDALGQLVAGEGTVYPVLRRLEAAGHVSSAWEQREAGNPRKYYTITEGGRAFLERALNELDGVLATLDGLRGIR